MSAPSNEERPPRVYSITENLDFEPVDELGLYRSEWAATQQQMGVDVDDFDEQLCRLLNASRSMYLALTAVVDASETADSDWFAGALQAAREAIAEAGAQ